MDKNQYRSIFGNFFDLRDTVDDGSEASQADIVEVSQSEVDRGDTSVSLTQDQSEPILTKTTDLVETTSDSLEDQGTSQGSSEGTQTQQLEPLKSTDVILPTSELGIQNTSVAYTEIESVNANPLAFTRVALRAEVSSGTYGL